MIPFLDLKASHAEIASDLTSAYERVLASSLFITGPELEAFESEFANYCGRRYCVGVGNGLDALTLSLRALGVGPGDEVIVPSQTFIATWLAVSAVGATPVPAEVDERTLNISPSAVQASITGRTKVVMPVHLFGAPAEVAALKALTDKHNVVLLEDAAQAHGAIAANAADARLSRAACYSFYPTKNLGAVGDGGAVVTDDEQMAETLRQLRNYGSKQKYVHEVIGCNTRLDELQAAFLRVKLKHLNRWNEQRRSAAARYNRNLAGARNIRLPQADKNDRHVYHLFVIRVPQRNRMQKALADLGTSTQIHYPIPPHLQGAFAQLGIKPGSLAVAEAAASESLSLPMWPQISDAQVDAVCEAVLKFNDAQRGGVSGTEETSLSSARGS